VSCINIIVAVFIIIASANRHCETEDKLYLPMTESVTAIVVTNPANLHDPLKRKLCAVRETANRFNLEEAIKHCFRN
jgi:hypothetical protein